MESGWGRRPSEERLENMRRAEYPSGVAVDPTPITSGQEITILYYGLLARSGADQIWLRLGYGPAQSWEAVEEVPMERTGYGWAKVFQVKPGSRLNFCFRDSAHNWDNNNGYNWSYEIHHGYLH